MVRADQRLSSSAFFEPRNVSKVLRYHANRVRSFSLVDFSTRCAKLLLHSNALGINLATLRSCHTPDLDGVARLVHNAAADDFAERIFQLDYLRPMRQTACRRQTEHVPLLEQLHKQGFAQVNDFGLDVHALQAQSEQILGSTRSMQKGEILFRNPIPALEPLLANTSLAHVMRSYLGGSARYDGHSLLHLNLGGQHDPSISAKWHHDRCGRRLKLFVFVHDVTRHDRPTLIADGSHNLWYFLYQYTDTSRFNPNYVQAHYHITPMVGQAGGGFIFDTNTIHTRDPEGSNQTRTTVTLEFHAHAKIPALTDFSGPCPSYGSKGSDTADLGQPGFRNYPQESKFTTVRLHEG